MPHPRTRCVVAFALLGVLPGGCASDHTRGQSDVCEVHHACMKRTTIPIHYGLPEYGDRERARSAAERSTFPRADEWMCGGCIVETFSPRQVVVYICTQCKAARAQWEREYDQAHGADSSPAD